MCPPCSHHWSLKDGTLASDRSRDFGFYLPDLAIAASALLELSTYAGNGKAKRYLDYARKVLHSLAGPLYRAEYGHNGGFILMHCVGSLPANSEVDVPLVYADYYFIEALYRYDSLLKGEKLTHG